MILTSVVGVCYSEESRLTELKNFLTKVPQDVLSLASYNCGAVTRSMMHHEHFMRSSGRVNCRQENLDFLLVNHASIFTFLIFLYMFFVCPEIFAKICQLF